MKIKPAFGALFLLANFVFVSPVFAGGFGIDHFVQGPNGASFASPGQAYTLTFGVHTHTQNLEPCKQCPTKIAFLNPQPGDIVNPVSDKTDDNGEITVKVSSQVPYIRYVEAVATLPDRTVYGEGIPQVLLNFTGKDLPYSETNNPIYNLPANPSPAPSNRPNTAINAWLLNQKLIENNQREVTVKWSAFDGNPGTFSILGRLTSNKNNWDKLLEGQRGPSATVTIPNEDYSIQMHGCMDKVGICANSNILLLPKIQIQDGKAIIQSPISLQPGDSRVDDLNKKVNDLQNQLEQSKKTQSVLEQRINDLVNFIKKLFPFFK